MASTRCRGARFAARYEPRYSLSDQAEDEAIIVVEAHEGRENPTVEFQREIMERATAILKQVAGSFRLSSHGIVCASPLDFRKVLDSQGVDTGLRLWAKDRADAQNQLRSIAAYLGVPSGELFVSTSPKVKRIRPAYMGEEPSEGRSSAAELTKPVERFRR